DVSPDMLALCRQTAEREGVRPRLYQQALHDMELPRRYRTIVVCGVFGIGGGRRQDTLALQRFYQHLNPGGALLLDNHLPYGSAREWALWRKGGREHLPEPWPEGVGKLPPGGSDYELHSRVVAFDPLEQQITRQMRALLWRDGQVVADDEYTLYENLYFRNELRQMLEQAGFEIEAIQGGYTGAEATAEDEVIVFVGRKKGRQGPF